MIENYERNKLHEYLNKWINKKDIKDAISFYGNCEYSSYLKKLI